MNERSDRADTLLVRWVNASVRNARAVVALGVLLCVGSLYYTANNLAAGWLADTPQSGA